MYFNERRTVQAVQHTPRIWVLRYRYGSTHLMYVISTATQIVISFILCSFYMASLHERKAQVSPHYIAYSRPAL